jgi:hypothetical protein
MDHFIDEGRDNAVARMVRLLSAAMDRFSASSHTPLVPRHRSTSGE